MELLKNIIKGIVFIILVGLAIVVMAGVFHPKLIWASLGIGFVGLVLFTTYPNALEKFINW